MCNSVAEKPNGIFMYHLPFLPVSSNDGGKNKENQLQFMLLLHTYTFPFFNWELQERLSNMAHDILNSLRAASLTGCVSGVTKKEKHFTI